MLAALISWNDPQGFMLSENALFKYHSPLSLDEVKVLCGRLDVLRHGPRI